MLPLRAVRDEPGDVVDDEHAVALRQRQVARRVVEHVDQDILGNRGGDRNDGALIAGRFLGAGLDRTAEGPEHGLIGVLVRLERELDRFQGVAEDTAIDREVNRHREHGPLEAADGVGPEGDPGPGDQVGVGDVVGVVEPARDLPVFRAPEDERSREIADDIDDPEACRGPPPVDLTGVPDEQAGEDQEQGDVLGADDPEGRPGVEAVQVVHGFSFRSRSRRGGRNGPVSLSKTKSPIESGRRRFRIFGFSEPIHHFHGPAGGAHCQPAGRLQGRERGPWPRPGQDLPQFAVGDQLLHPASREDAQRDPVATPAADEDDPLVPRGVGDHRQGVEGVGDHPGPAPCDGQVRERGEPVPECLGPGDRGRGLRRDDRQVARPRRTGVARLRRGSDCRRSGGSN